MTAPTNVANTVANTAQVVNMSDTSEPAVIQMPPRLVPPSSGLDVPNSPSAVADSCRLSHVVPSRAAVEPPFYFIPRTDFNAESLTHNSGQKPFQPDRYLSKYRSESKSVRPIPMGETVTATLPTDASSSSVTTSTTTSSSSSTGLASSSSVASTPLPLTAASSLPSSATSSSTFTTASPPTTTTTESTGTATTTTGSTTTATTTTGSTTTAPITVPLTETDHYVVLSPTMFSRLSVQTVDDKEKKENRIPVDRATAIRFSDMIRVTLEWDPNAVEMPINLREDIAGMVSAYLHHHRSTLVPKRILRPLREKEFSKNIEDPWDYGFIEWVYHLPSTLVPGQTTTDPLYKLVHAAFYLGMPSLSDLCLAKLASKVMESAQQPHAVLDPDQSFGLKRMWHEEQARREQAKRAVADDAKELPRSTAACVPSTPTSKGSASSSSSTLTCSPSSTLTSAESELAKTPKKRKPEE